MRFWSALLCVGLLTSSAVAVLGAQETAAEDRIGVDQKASLGEPLGKPLAGEALERETDRVASKMRCPVCQGLSVADSRTVSALAMKGEVSDFLAAGYTEEQVLAYFERSYGEFIRLAPKAEGFNLLVWIFPLLFVLIGGALVFWRLRSQPPREAVEDSDPELDAYRERVRRELGS